MDLTGLRPGCLFSLFENHFDETPVRFTPLDGSGTSSTIVADVQRRAHLVVTALRTLTHDNAVLVVYRSDDVGHGASRGTIGVNAQHQLIARTPQAAYRQRYRAVYLRVDWRAHARVRQARSAL